MNYSLQTRTAGVLPLAAACVALLILPQAAAAWTTRTTWTAFMRAGPGRQFQVIDEVEKFSSVEVESCAKGWCMVIVDRSEGFMPADVLTPSDLSPPPPETGPQPAPCFTEDLTGFRGHEGWRFCGR